MIDLIGLPWKEVAFDGRFIEGGEVWDLGQTTTKSKRICQVKMTSQLSCWLKQMKDVQELELCRLGKRIHIGCFVHRKGTGRMSGT